VENSPAGLAPKAVGLFPLRKEKKALLRFHEGAKGGFKDTTDISFQYIFAIHFRKG
jgi:hypothetical protein